jgi:hypothetical protein
LILPILTTIKISPDDLTDLIAYFSFASNFAIGFTKSVLITSLSLNRATQSQNTYPKYTISNFQIACILVMFQFVLSITLLSNSIITLLIIHLGLISMIHLEYRCQSRAIIGKWKGAILTYLSLIILFITATLTVSISQEITSRIILQIWATATILISCILFIFDYRNTEINHVNEYASDNTRSFLAIDFLLNYGLMQLIYSVGTLITDSNEMIKYRLLMFLSIPTNIVMQILSTSGLTFIFSDTKRRKEKMLIFDVLASAPLMIIVIIFAKIGSETLRILFGEIWSEIPSLLLYFLIMSLSAIVLTHTAMVVKWNGLTSSLLKKRIVISALQVPVTLLAMMDSGAIGILFSLIVFNVLYTFVNLFAIKNENGRES